MNSVSFLVVRIHILSLGKQYESQQSATGIQTSGKQAEGFGGAPHPTAAQQAPAAHQVSGHTCKVLHSGEDELHEVCTGRP